MNSISAPNPFRAKSKGAQSRLETLSQVPEANSTGEK